MAVANESLRAYDAIRTSLGDFALPPGRQIPIHVIAYRLGMSVEPVEDACDRLAAEGWAIPGTKTAYFAWRPDENTIAGLYDCNRAIVMAAIDEREFETSGDDPDRALIRDTRERLARRRLSHASLAASTGGLFAAIVAGSGKRDLTDLVRAANERLLYLRLVECQHISDTASQLIALCDLHLDSRLGELRQAIASYHDQRRALVPQLYGTLAAR